MNYKVGCGTVAFILVVGLIAFAGGAASARDRANVETIRIQATSEAERAKKASDLKAPQANSQKDSRPTRRIIKGGPQMKSLMLVNMLRT